MKGREIPGIIRDVSPCNGCTERFPACSGKCPIDERGGYGYNAWIAELERVKKARKDYIKYTMTKDYDYK